jgi:selenoprotein W-related protein
MRAARLAGEIIEDYGDHLESITLIRSSGGRFEVEVDNQLIFSKEQTHRHANPGEVVESIRQLFPVYAQDLHEGAHG